MKNQIYKIALDCHQYVNEYINVQRNKIVYREKGLVFIDYDIFGDVQQYETLLLKLHECIKEKYPSMALSLKTHIDNYDNDRIIHFSAIQAIVDCVVSLEKKCYREEKDIY